MLKKILQNICTIKIKRLPLYKKNKTMLNLKFIEPKETDGAAKLTVHKSGKIGLSKSAAELLNIKNNKYCQFARDEDNVNDSILYMLVNKENDEKSFFISKAGDYYYVKAKSLLNDLDIDYTDKTKTIIFDIHQIEYEGNKIYKLTKRIINKK